MRDPSLFNSLTGKVTLAVIQGHTETLQPQLGVVMTYQGCR